MGTTACTLGNVQRMLCPQDDGLAMDDQYNAGAPQSGQNHLAAQRQESKEEDFIGISGISVSKLNIPSEVSAYTVNEAELDLSQLKRELKSYLMTVKIVRKNVLQLMFKQKGFSINYAKCIVSDDGTVVTLQIVDHSHTYSDFSKQESLSAAYTLPEGVKVVKCSF